MVSMLFGNCEGNGSEWTPFHCQIIMVISCVVDDIDVPDSMDLSEINMATVFQSKEFESILDELENDFASQQTPGKNECEKCILISS